jgi:hypothetical protein
MSSRIAQRQSVLGVVGKAIAQHLGENDSIVEMWDPGGQVYYVSRLCERGEYKRAAAVSLLVLEYPTQTAMPTGWLSGMLEGIVSDWCSEKRASAKPGWELFDARGRDVLPLKGHPGAMNKVNVWFSELAESLRKEKRAIHQEMIQREYLFEGLYNDQASAVLLMREALAGLYTDPLGLAAMLVHEKEFANGVNLMVKTLGLNATVEGAVVCEAKTLRGRGVASVDWDSEAGYRCDAEEVAQKVWSGDMHALRSEVRKILKCELGLKEVIFEELGESWSKRWLWCVNGSHSRRLERIDPQFRIGVPGRVHRKVFSENTDVDPVSKWKGRPIYGASEKLEKGATRAIFAGDSLTYFAFEHLLKPVERAWIGKRVLLDPGKGGQLNMIRKVRKLRAHAGVAVMLDYDDFNSQHSLDAQAAVIEELCEHVGYPPELGAKLVQSFYEGRVFWPGGEGKHMGTLMSGHRGTTFINSVLNMAYITVAHPQLWDGVSMHVGDDVIIGAETTAQAAQLLKSVAGSGVRMNPMKQSYGPHVAEFLRTAVTDSHAFGYVARSVSSIISGNWVSDVRLSAEESMRTISSQCWSLTNRSQGKDIGWLLARSLSRAAQLPLKIARGIVCGYVSVDGGPVRAGRPSYQVVSYVSDETCARKSLQTEIDKIEGKAFATEAYLQKHVTPVERIAMASVGGDVRGMMLESSYTKSLISRGVETAKSEAIRVTSVYETANTATEVEAAQRRKESEPRPLLAGYPMIELIKNRLTRRVVTALLRSLNLEHKGDVMEAAFGRTLRSPCAVSSPIPYSIAESLCGYAQLGVLYSMQPIYV